MPKTERHDWCPDHCRFERPTVWRNEGCLNVDYCRSLLIKLMIPKLLKRITDWDKANYEREAEK